MVSSNRLIQTWALFSLLGLTLWGLPGYADPDKIPAAADALNIEQDLVQRSPVLKRWLDSPPSVLSEIDNNPAFPTKFKIGVASVPSRDNDYELALGVEDIFLWKSRFTASVEYRQSLNQNIHNTNLWGGNVRYYLLPLGAYVNLAPQVGYTSLRLEGAEFQGPELGGKLVFALSQTADVSVTETIILPSQGQTVGRTQLSFGYALSPSVRVSADLGFINAPTRQDTSFGINFELTSY
jgi:hypothetical protein